MKRLYTLENVDELNTNIEAYFAELEATNDKDKDKNPGFAGLAYALGFCERRSLNDYAALDEEELSTPIKRAMLRIEASYESGLHRQACTGSIFALKNRGWTDKQEIEHSVSEESYDKLKSLYE